MLIFVCLVSTLLKLKALNLHLSGSYLQLSVSIHSFRFLSFLSAPSLLSQLCGHAYLEGQMEPKIICLVVRDYQPIPWWRWRDPAPRHSGGWQRWSHQPHCLKIIMIFSGILGSTYRQRLREQREQLEDLKIESSGQV